METAPEGFTQEEWDDLSNEEREGLLSVLEEEEGAEGDEIEIPAPPAKEEPEIPQPAAAAEPAAAPAAEPAAEPAAAAEPEAPAAAAVPDVEARIGALEARIDELADEGAEELLENGNSERYREIQREIQKVNREIIHVENQAREAEATAAAEEVQAMQRVAADAYGRFPFLNIADKANVNLEAVQQVVQLRERLFNAGGVTRAQALAEAVDLVGPRYGAAAAPATPQTKPAQPRPDIKSLGKLPQEAAEDTGNDPFANIDRLEGEEYEAALERMTPAQREAHRRGGF